VTAQGTEVDQQAEMLRIAERTARATESIRAIMLIWSVFSVLGLIVYLVQATTS
jgi:hypothetical protein